MTTNHNSNGRPAIRKGRTWLALGVLAALALIPLFTRPGPLRVRTTTVERGAIRSLISTNGKVEPIRNFEAHSPVATTVKAITFARANCSCSSTTPICAARPRAPKPR